MVERPLSMREVPSSILGSSTFCILPASAGFCQLQGRGRVWTTTGATPVATPETPSSPHSSAHPPTRRQPIGPLDPAPLNFGATHPPVQMSSLTLGPCSCSHLLLWLPNSNTSHPNTCCCMHSSESLAGPQIVNVAAPTTSEWSSKPGAQSQGAVPHPAHAASRRSGRSRPDILAILSCGYHSPFLGSMHLLQCLQQPLVRGRSAPPASRCPAPSMLPPALLQRSGRLLCPPRM